MRDEDIDAQDEKRILDSWLYKGLPFQLRAYDGEARLVVPAVGSVVSELDTTPQMDYLHHALAARLDQLAALRDPEKYAQAYEVDS